MRDPAIVPGPLFTPGRCFACGAADSEMVDTMIDLIGDGRIYLCLRTCLPQYARLAGYATPSDVVALREIIAAATDRVAGLERELAHERAHKTVDVPVLLEMFEQARQSRRGNAQAKDAA